MEDLSPGLAEAPYSRQQKTSTASEQLVQGPSIEESAVARKALDLRNEPARPTGLCALKQAEMGVPPGLAASLGVTFLPLDAATVLLAQPLFRVRTGDGH